MTSERADANDYILITSKDALRPDGRIENHRMMALLGIHCFHLDMHLRSSGVTLIDKPDSLCLKERESIPRQDSGSK